MDDTGLSIRPLVYANPEVLIYPNPGNGQFMMETEGLPEGPVTIVAHNIMGAEVMRWRFHAARQVSRFTFEPPGNDQVLLLTIHHQQGQLVKRYVRNR